MGAARLLLQALDPRFARFLMRRLGAGGYRLLAAYRAERHLSPASRLRISADAVVGNVETLSLGEGVTIGAGSEVLEVDHPTDGAGPGRLVLGHQVRIGKRVQLGVQPGTTLEIGDHTSIHNGCILIGDIAIGRYCLFSNNVFVSSGDHFHSVHPSWLIRDQDALVASDPEFAQERRRSVTIEDDCWIGWGAVIKRGLYIGKGALVGANAVVTRDVFPYTIHGGVPSRPVGKRLEFAPPCEVEAAREKDWPYFYSGFALRQTELIASLRRGVAFASRRARLVLQGGPWTRLALDGILGDASKAVSLRVAIGGIPVETLRIRERHFSQKIALPQERLTDEAPSLRRVATVLQPFTEITLDVVEADGSMRAGHHPYGLAAARLT